MAEALGAVLRVVGPKELDAAIKARDEEMAAAQDAANAPDMNLTSLNVKLQQADTESGSYTDVPGGDAGTLLSALLGGLAGSFHELHGAVADGVDVRRLTHLLHGLHLKLHELVDGLHDLRRDFRIIAGVQPPGAIGR